MYAGFVFWRLSDLCDKSPKLTPTIAVPYNLCKELRSLPFSLFCIITVTEMQQKKKGLLCSLES